MHRSTTCFGVVVVGEAPPDQGLRIEQSGLVTGAIGVCVDLTLV